MLCLRLSDQVDDQTLDRNADQKNLAEKNSNARPTIIIIIFIRTEMYNHTNKPNKR